MDSSSFQVHCTTLELRSSFDEHELKAAYRKQILAWHPDRHPDTPDLQATALRRAQAINAAYEFLSELMESGALAYRTQANRRASSRAPADHKHDHYQTRHSYRGKTYRVGLPDKAVVEVFLKSSHIVSTGHDAARRLLYIKFDDSSVYRYSDVPEDVFREFVSADSHGRYAHSRIYRWYAFVRC